MNPIEDITVPLLWEPPPISCRFVRWLVPDGGHVCVYQGIFEIEIDGSLIEVESFHTGHMKQLVADGTQCRVGDRIATIVVDEISPQFRPVPFFLAGREIAIVDSLRGETPREIFIRDTFLKAIGVDPSVGQ